MDKSFSNIDLNEGVCTHEDLCSLSLQPIKISYLTLFFILFERQVGAFGTKSRVQPRFVQGQQYIYDQTCAQRTQQEL